MNSNRKTLELAVSVISTSPSNFLQHIEAFPQLGVSRIHVDIMDGNFVPRLGLYPEFVKEISSKSDLPIDIHLMTVEPEKHFEVFASAGASRIIPHVEALPHANRAIRAIRDFGLEAGVALNPHTGFDSIKYLLDDLSSIMVMAINPGVLGHKFIPSVYAKISEFYLELRQRDFAGILEIDGGVTFDNLEKIASFGSQGLVLGAGTIFHPGQSISENMKVISHMVGSM